MRRLAQASLAALNLRMEPLAHVILTPRFAAASGSPRADFTARVFPTRGLPPPRAIPLAPRRSGAGPPLPPPGPLDDGPSCPGRGSDGELRLVRV
eukprot:3939296-Pyramimonas_sp.AAC.1